MPFLLTSLVLWSRLVYVWLDISKLGAISFKLCSPAPASRKRRGVAGTPLTIRGMDPRTALLGNREMIDHHAHSGQGQGLAFQQASLLRGCHLPIQLHHLLFNQQLGESVERSCRDERLKTLLEARGQLVCGEQMVSNLLHAWERPHERCQALFAPGGIDGAREGDNPLLH